MVQLTRPDPQVRRRRCIALGSGVAMRKTSYRVSGFMRICLSASLLGLFTLAIQAQPPVSHTTLVGCLVSESEYASAKGLADPARNARESQLVVVLAPSDRKPRGGDAGRSAYALTGPQ